MDAQIGRVLKALDKSGRADDTIVVFASDNGPVTSRWINYWEVNSYGSTGGLRGRKHFLYEGGIKAPAIVRYPGVTRPGSTTDELVVGWDLFTTLALIGGAEVPADRAIDGVDILPALSGGKLPVRTVVWALDSVSDLEFAVRHGDWKLLLDRERKPKELYNLAEDRLELFNLLAEQEQVHSRVNREIPGLRGLR